MANEQNKQPLLAKLGLNEQDQSLVKRAIIISSVICALIIAAFFVYQRFYATVPETVEAQQLTVVEDFTSGDIGELDIEAHEIVAQRFMQTGRPDAAVPHLLRIIAARGDDDAAYLALDNIITAYLEVGEFENALEAIDNLLRIFAARDLTSIEPSLMVRRGIALYHLGQFTESSEVLQAVLANDTNNVEALVFMAQVEAATQARSPTAERFFRRALTADPTNPEALYQFARYHENLGDYAGAREILLRVLQKEPLNIRAHARLGMLYYYMLDADNALKSYQTALALNPHDYNTRYNLGELYRTLLNDNESALREFVRALEDNPQHIEANFKAGLICAGNNMLREAVRYFEASLENDRRNIRGLLQLAAAYERLGDRENALLVYREAFDVDPLNIIAGEKIRLLSMRQRDVTSN